MRRMSLTSRAVHCSSAAISSGERLAAELLHQLALDVHDLVELLDHVHRDADGARLVGDRPRHGLADPPGGVGRELVAAPVVELLDRADQPQRALLDQVEERQAAAQVALGDRDDEAQVGLDHLRLGRHVAALDALGQRDLLLGGQQVHAADRAQVQPQRVEARLDREVDLRLLGRLPAGRRSCARLAVGRRRPSGLPRRRPRRPRRSRPGGRAGRAPAPWSPRPPRGSPRSPRRSGTRARDPRPPACAAPRPRGTARRAAPPTALLLLFLPQPSLLRTRLQCRPSALQPALGLARYVTCHAFAALPRGAEPCEGVLRRGPGFEPRRDSTRRSCGLARPRRSVSSQRSWPDLTTATHDDVQARRPTTHVSLTRVGVTGVEKVIRIDRRRASSSSTPSSSASSTSGRTRRARTCRASRRSSTRRSTRSCSARRSRPRRWPQHIAERVRDRQEGAARRGHDRGPLPRAQARRPRPARRRRRSTRCSAPPWPPRAARAG